MNLQGVIFLSRFKMLSALVLIGTLVFVGTIFSACKPNNGIDPNSVVDVDSTAVASEDPLGGLIHENIWINDVNVGGLTMDEAKTLLTAELQGALDASSVVFLDGEDEVHTLPLSDFGIQLDLDGVIRKAYDYTRQEGMTEKQIREALAQDDLDLEAGCFFDTEAITAALTTLDTTLSVAPVEPKVQRANGAFYTEAGKPGTKLNIEQTTTAFTEALKDYHGIGGRMEVALTIEEVQPKFTTNDLSTAMTLLGTWTTSYSGSSANRATNLRVSSGSINNTFLLPGEVFSTNATFGPTTAANGYMPGGTYVDGKVVDSYGGGVCQTSSTLYRALLAAELQIVERQNHSLPVGYMTLGFDATLAGDYIDLKFKNSTDSPILIETLMGNGSLTVNIYGRETRDPSRKIDFKSTCTGTFTPPPEKVKDDPTLPLGERVVDVPAKTGSEYQVYKYVYVNGKLVDTIHINTSRYRTVAAEVRVGTGPAAAPSVEPVASSAPPVVVTPPPTPVPTPEPTPIVDPTPEPTPEQPVEPIDEPEVV